MVFYERVPHPSEDAGTNIGRFRFAFWFAIASALLILANTILFAVVLVDRSTEHILARDAQVSTQYVNSIVRTVGATSYFHGDSYNPKAPEMEEFFRQVSRLPEVIRANVYGLERTVLWSSESNMLGQAFEDNIPLENAFKGISQQEVETAGGGEKDDHVAFPPEVKEFIEFYVPIWSEDRSKIVGAVEIYKATDSLFSEIASVRNTIWLGSAVGALVLFLGLSGVVHIVRRILSEQEQRLIESEKYAVVGEMTSAVAHGLRNPLAAIRSSAELALDEDLPETVREPLTDIVGQAERLEVWIRSFLLQAREGSGALKAPVLMDDVLRDCVAGFAHQLQSRNIRLAFDIEGNSPLVPVKRSELVQVFNTLMSNSVEAIGRDGEILIRRKADGHGSVFVTIEDDGPGIAPEMAGKLFRPFSTGKGKGLGVGLSLTKRILERCGGTIELVNRAMRGVSVTVVLPAAGG